MADRYTATGVQATVAATPDTALAVIASASTRGRIYHSIMSQSAAPADSIVVWTIQRFTAVGTEGAGVTPAKHDLAAPAAQLDGGEDHSAEPTYTAATELLEFDLNQRATFYWDAGDDRELVVPATAGAGIGWEPGQGTGSYAGAVTASASWLE